MAASGNTVGSFDTHGTLLQLMGLTSGSGKLLYNNTLKMRVGSTYWYLPLSSAQGSYTSAYPIALTCAADAITVTQTDSAGGINAILVNNTVTATGAVAHKAVEVNVVYDPASTGGSVPIAIAGKVTLAAGKTHNTLYMWGIQGGLKFLTGSTVDSNQAAAARFVLEEAGAVTYTGKVTGLYVDNLITSPMGSESSQGISIARFANHGGNVNSMLEFYANECDNLFAISGSLAASGGPVVETSNGGATRKYRVEVMIEGDTCYLSAYTD